MNTHISVGVSIVIAWLAVLLPAAPCPAAAGEGEWTVVATYAVPEGASGLAFDGTWLYCGIYGVDGGRVYRIDPSDGTATLLFTGPHGDAFGLTYDGANLWTTDHGGSSSTPAVAMKLDWDGTVLEEIDLPAHYVSGIAYDAGDFWVARYYSDPSHLFKVDAAGTVLDDLLAPDDQPWDLALQDDALWIADYFGDTLYKIDPARGDVLASHPSEGVDPAGIVWDGTHLWYCDNGDDFAVDFLYKVDLAGTGTPEITVPIDTHDYGLVSIGDSIAWDVTVQNTGTAALRIDAVTFDPPADLSTPVGFPITIPAFGSTQVPVGFAPATFGALDATATLVSSDPIHPEVAVSLTGHGVYPTPTIDVATSAHDFGPVRVDAHTRWFMRIQNHGHQPLIVDALELDDGHFYVDGGVTLPVELAPLASVDVGVWFNPNAASVFAATLSISSNDRTHDPLLVALTGSGLEAAYEMGAVLWSYTIDTSFDNTPKAMSPIPDISGDGVADVIVCSEDDFVRCFNGNASGTGDVLWEHEIFAGSVYAQKGLQIIPDIDEDGMHDVVVGAAWGGKLIRAISGATGEEVWTKTTDQYGDGGWVYQVDCRYDYNDDGSVDALAATGDDGDGTGPRRVYCLNGLTGASIWERPLGGPVFAVIGVEDFTGDGQADVIAGASNASETQGTAYGLDGATGSIEWSFDVPASSVWALAQLADITGDTTPDVVIGDFAGTVFGLDATTGAQMYATGGFGLTTDFVRLDDVDDDGHPEIVPQHLRPFARMVGGQTGATVWSTPLADKAGAVARVPDLTGDGINDVLVGTLFSDNFVYFLDGVDGAVLESLDYGTPVDGINAIPDITGDGSSEMIVGGRDGTLTVFSGGLAATHPADLDGDGTVGFGDLLIVLAAWGPNPGHPADLDGDGIVGFTDLLVVLAAWGA